MTNSTRITIMLDDDLLKKVRTKQAKKINDEQKTYSFSAALNDMLRGN